MSDLFEIVTGTETPEIPAYEFDFNRITVDESIEFDRAILSGNKDRAIPWYVRVTIRWPFPGDPSDPASFGKLGLADFAEVQRNFWESFRSLFEPAARAAGVARRGGASK